MWRADALMTLQQRTNKSHKIMHHTGEKMVRLFYVSPCSPALYNTSCMCACSVEHRWAVWWILSHLIRAHCILVLHLTHATGPALAQAAINASGLTACPVHPA